MNLSRKPLVTAALSFFLIASVAFAAGQTGIPVEDGGEFLTVARLGGIDHPPGMPLVSLAARVSWILFGPSGLRVLFALVTSLLLVLLISKPSLPMILFAPGVILLPGVMERLLIWDAYCPLLLIYAFALYRRPKASLEGGYLTGLALAVHPMGIFLPVLLEWREFSPLKFLSGAVMGLSLYLALPIYSASGAIVDWGSTGDISHFLRQLSAGGYREVYGGSMGGISINVLLLYLGSVWRILWPVLLVPAAMGAVSMFGMDRGRMIRLEVLFVLDLLFVTLVNPMAAGTSQTAILALFAILAFAAEGMRMVAGWSARAGLVLGIAVLAGGILLWKPLPDQEEPVNEYFSRAPLESGFFLRNNDLLYGGWVMKYVNDRRPDIVLLSPDNFSHWFEAMVNHFNPDVDLSKGVQDVGDLSMGRDELSRRLISATVEDNPGREFFSDF